jgi:prepilin-type N-terminal cleavage/methylation domain-containing protein
MGDLSMMFLQGSHRQRILRHSGFTLIELMVVIAVIIILVGFSIPALTKAQQNAKRAKAKVQVRQIEKAFVAYHDEYGEWPKEMTSYDSNPREDSLTGIEIEEKCAQMLAGEAVQGTDGVYNEQEIKFLPKVNIAMSQDGDYSKRGFLDPWGHCYKYMMDFNDDGVVKVQYSNASGGGDRTEEVRGQGVAVWSRGGDGIDNIDGDDITSWKVK